MQLCLWYLEIWYMTWPSKTQKYRSKKAQNGSTNLSEHWPVPCTNPFLVSSCPSITSAIFTWSLKRLKKWKLEMGKSNIILCMKILSLKISTKNMQRNVNVNVIKFSWLCLWISRQKQSAVILCGKSNVKLQILEIYFGILIIYQWDWHIKISITKWYLVALYVQNLLQKYDESTCCGGLHTLSTCCTCAKIMWHFECTCVTPFWWDTLSAVRMLNLF